MDPQPVEAVDSLRECLESGDQAAWDRFIARVHRVIASTVIRSCRERGHSAAPELVDDLTQETYVRLFANGHRVLREFVPRHQDSLFGLLKTVAYSVVQDYFRSQAASKRGAGVDNVVINEEVTADRDGPEAIERGVLLNEIGGRVQHFSKRDQRIFGLHFRHGMSARTISELPQITLDQKGVESAIARMKKALRTEMAEHAKGNTPPTPFLKEDGR